LTYVKNQLEITQAITTSSITFSKNPQQYSDQETFTVKVANGYISSQKAASSAIVSIGAQQMGVSITLAQDGSTSDLIGTSTVPLLESTQNGQLAPGDRAVKVTFNEDNKNFDVEPVDSTLTITKEDARMYYSGDSMFSTGSTNVPSVEVTSSVIVKDITAVSGDPSYDANAGDIRNAKVTFYKDGVAICSNVVPVISGSETKEGTASCKWTGLAGSSGSQQYLIQPVVTNYYTDTLAGDGAMIITVYQPITSNFITGGGYLVLGSNSAGSKAGDSGSKNNFGFNVKYNKAGTNLQGTINTIIRRTESNGIHLYQVKGNSLTNLIVTANPLKPSVSSPAKATFIGKANLADVTNPSSPVSLGGNAKLQVTMTDSGEPGSSDKIGITVWDGSSALWFSSNTIANGLATEQTLGGGNLVVH
jgi:hypothetical protein